MLTIVPLARSPRLRLALLFVFALLVLAGCSGSDGQAVTDPLDPAFQQDTYRAVTRVEGWYWMVVGVSALAMGASFVFQPVLPEWARSYNVGFRLAVIAIFVSITIYRWAMNNAKASMDNGFIFSSLDTLQHLLAPLSATLTHLIR
jgi:hypothetical protein